LGRPNWYYEHWPTCTCAECERRRRYSRGYYQERNPWHTLLTVVIILFILGIVVALAFVGVEPLPSVNIGKYPAGAVYYLGCSENIFQCTLAKVYWYNKSGVLARAEYYTLTEIAELAVKGWMGSQGHRENILKSYWRTEGIGVAISASGDVYITQNFN